MVENLTVIIPFYQGHDTIERLVKSLPSGLPVLIIDDISDPPLQRQDWMGENLKIIRLPEKSYFAGAVNKGIVSCRTDVLVLNQDVWFESDYPFEMVEEYRSRYAMIGERIQGDHPAFGSFGYIHGVFMFLRRDALDTVGLLNHREYPLWGNTAEWQWRVVRAGFEVYPVQHIAGLHHERPKNERFGSSIKQLVTENPKIENWLVQTPPLLSVIVPCHNYGRYLSDCIASLIGGNTSLGKMPGQTLQSFEVIVVDDASTDETPERMAELCDIKKGIRGYRLEENQGTARTLNYGIEKAVGRYITFLSADDMREPESLEALVRTCQQHPHSFAYDDIWLVYKGKRIRKWVMEEYDFDTLIFKNQVHAGIVFPKKAWEEVGGYPAIMNDGREDWAFNVALGVKGWCGQHVKQFGYLYRRENQNRSLTNTSPQHYEKFLNKISGLFPEIYRGERPMACCGKGRTQPSARSSASSRSSAPVERGMRRSVTTNGVSGGAMAVPENTTGMVKLVYQGKGMLSVWDGPVTNTRYRFGADKPKGWVYKQDAGERGRNGFLNLKDSRGNYLFEQDGDAELPASGPVITPAPAGAIQATAQAPKQVATQNVVDIQKDPVVVIGEAPKEEPDYPDPKDLNVAEIQALELTPEQWQKVYKAELAGLARKSALTFMEKQIASDNGA